MTNLDSILKSRDITLPTKVHKELEVEGGGVTCSSLHSVGVVTLEFSLQRKTEKKKAIMQVKSLGT